MTFICAHLCHLRTLFVRTNNRSALWRRVRFLVMLIASTSLFAVAVSAGAAAPDYDRDIRPILSDRCFFCHGPDEGRREADLRLDTFEGITASAVVPGKPDESELVARITSDDPDYQMPPPQSHL